MKMKLKELKEAHRYSINNMIALLESKDAKVFQCLKLEIFIPESHFSRLQEVLQRVDAGHIGNYDSCLSFSEVMSTWRPLKGTDPYIGSVGELSLEPELKVEVTIRAENLEKTLSAIREVHPYEEPVINVLPLLGTGIMNQV